MQNYCIHSYTTHKSHDNKCKYIEDTWGKHVDNLFFYTDKEIENSKYIYCTNDDTYESHMYKNFYAIQYAYDNCLDFDWHLFIGDDNFIYHKNLENLLKKLNPDRNEIYGELLKPGVGWKDLEYIGGGPGILFNKTSLKVFVENNKMSKEEKKYYEFSDVAIGIICKKNNILLSPQQGFFTHPPHAYGISEPEKHISFHYIKDEKYFQYLYSRY